MENKKKSIKVSSRKAKGRDLQDLACELVSKAIGIPWDKTDDSEIKPRPMGQPGPDVILSKRARKLFAFTIECKNQQTWSIPSWIKQAETNCVKETNWLLIMKKTSRTKDSRIKPMVVLEPDVFFELIKKGLKCIDTP